MTNEQFEKAQEILYEMDKLDQALSKLLFSHEERIDKFLQDNYSYLYDEIRRITINYNKALIEVFENYQKELDAKFRDL